MSDKKTGAEADEPTKDTLKNAPEKDAVSASKEDDIPQPVFKNTGGADTAFGEVPDPVFDDRPIKMGGEIPDPVFDDNIQKPVKRRLSAKELAELSATLPSDINLSDEEGIPVQQRPRHEDAAPVNPLASSTQNADSDGDSNPESPRPEGTSRSRQPVDDMAALADERVLFGDENEEEEIIADELSRGEESELSSKDAGLRKILVGAGWDMVQFEGAPLDLDLSCFILNKNDQTRVDADFVFYNNPTGADLAVKHSGDSRDGAGEGDDEIITIDLEALPYDIYKIVFTVTIYQGDELEQNFGSVKNAYIRFLNQETKTELARFNLSEDFSEGTCLKFGELTRIGNKWCFLAIGETSSGGLSKIAQQYGLLISGT